MANEEWLNEPDFEEWVDEATGLICFINRKEPFGHLCGYVIVPPGSEFDGEIDQLVTVHGGITYTEDHLPMRNKNKIAAHPGSIVIGFDCAHLNDIIPYMTINYKYRNG